MAKIVKRFVKSIITSALELYGDGSRALALGFTYNDPQRQLVYTSTNCFEDGEPGEFLLGKYDKRQHSEFTADVWAAAEVDLIAEVLADEKLGPSAGVSDGGGNGIKGGKNNNKRTGLYVRPGKIGVEPFDIVILKRSLSEWVNKPKCRLSKASINYLRAKNPKFDKVCQGKENVRTTTTMTKEGRQEKTITTTTTTATTIELMTTITTTTTVSTETTTTLDFDVVMQKDDPNQLDFEKTFTRDNVLRATKLRVAIGKEH